MCVCVGGGGTNLLSSVRVNVFTFDLGAGRS